jgi:putative endonuclease
MKENFYIYITASLHNRVLYTGVTSDLQKRISEHKSRTIKGFTYKYNVDRLVYYEVHSNAEAAIKREKNIKDWKRQWKIDLIEKTIPTGTIYTSAFALNDKKIPACAGITRVS